jgi:hypothetical protein
MSDQILLKSQISFPQQTSDYSPLILQELRALKKEVQTKILDSWMDAKAAAKYMAISASSFDKYRYKTSPSLKGYNLDGKTLYKTSDIDSFIRLYELKSKTLI